MADIRKNLEIRIRALVEGAKNVLGLSRDVDRLQENAREEVADPTSRMREGVSRTRVAVGGLVRELGLLVGAGAIARFARVSADEAKRAQAAYLGLQSVAEHAGIGIGSAFGEAQRLAADGLLNVADASRSLQNLLARGFTLDQSIEVIGRLKDAAAFNRSAHLSLSEAVRTATEGLKNENSILVDNAGVTKNVSVLWKEYAEQIDVGVGSLTQAQKVTAEYNGILRETEAQVGNAAKAAAGLAGEEAKLAKASIDLKVALGSALTPAFTQLARGATFLVNKVLSPFLAGVETLTIRAAALGRVLAGALTLDINKMKSALEAAEGAIADVEARYEHGLIPTAVQAGESQRKLAGDLRETGKAAGEGAAAIEQASERSVRALEGEVAAHADAVAAAKSGARERERLAEDFADTLERLERGPEKSAEELGYLDIAKAVQEARDAINQGDLGGAVEGADRARELIEKAAEAGNVAQVSLRSLLEQARGVAEQAGAGIARQQQGAVDQARAQIQGLIEASKPLQSIAIGIDAEASKQSAEAAKSAIQAVFSAGITVPLNFQGAPAAGTDSAALADAATRSGGRG